MFSSVMRFMCGQMLQPRKNATPSVSAATLSLIEHSVTITTLGGFSVLTQSIMLDVDPAKSTTSITSGGHSGWAMILAPG